MNLCVAELADTMTQNSSKSGSLVCFRWSSDKHWSFNFIRRLAAQKMISAMMDFVDTNVCEHEQLLHESLIIQRPQIRGGSLTPSRALSQTHARHVK